MLNSAYRQQDNRTAMLGQPLQALLYLRSIKTVQTLRTILDKQRVEYVAVADHWRTRIRQPFCISGNAVMESLTAYKYIFLRKTKVLRSTSDGHDALDEPTGRLVWRCE